MIGSTLPLPQPLASKRTGSSHANAYRFAVLRPCLLLNVKGSSRSSVLIRTADLKNVDYAD